LFFHWNPEKQNAKTNVHPFWSKNMDVIFSLSCPLKEKAIAGIRVWKWRKKGRIWVHGNAKSAWLPCRLATLGATDFSSAVSGFCQVFIVTRARGFGLQGHPTTIFGRISVRKTIWDLNLNYLEPTELHYLPLRHRAMLNYLSCLQVSYVRRSKTLEEFQSCWSHFCSALRAVTNEAVPLALFVTLAAQSSEVFYRALVPFPPSVIPNRPVDYPSICPAQRRVFYDS